MRTTLGKWDVLRNKLLPLAERSGGDRATMRTLMKIFVLMTMPMSAKASLALATLRDPDQERKRAKDGLEKMSETKKRLRAAAMAQAWQLAEARAAFAERPKVLGNVLRLFEGLHKSRERRSE